MRYGHFDDLDREYVITQPDTPLPWINYLGSDDFFSLFSNTAGGYAFYRDARLRRLIRYRYNNAPLNVGGRFLYLRDDASGDWWNPGWAPSRRELDAYKCRHGLGYTVITGTRGGVRAETTYLVPPGQTLEVWRVRVTNERAEPARVSLVGAVEFCLWDAQDDATNYQRNYSTGEVLVEDGVVYHVTEYRERRDHFAWLAATEPVSGFDTARDAFLGPYRGWDAPVAMERGTLSRSVAHGWQPIGALQVEL
jgi:cellobiose phosphorylase